MFLILIIFTFGVSGLATLLVKSQIARYSKVPASSGLSGAETAARILQSRGIRDVQIIPANRLMGDHYDPLKKIIALTPDVYAPASTRPSATVTP